MSNRLGLAALCLLLLAGGLLLLFRQFPGAANEQGEQIRLVQGLLILTLAGGSFMLGWNERAGVALKQALIWAGMLVVLLTVYAYRYEFVSMGFRVAGVTVPTIPLAAPPTTGATAAIASTQPGVVYLHEVQGGHFRADASVNGSHVQFLVDTGASFVALSALDAQRLGFDLDSLKFDIPMNTANGLNYAAVVKLDELSIGSISRQNVPAIVHREGLEESLLGMSFLKSIGSFEMGDGVLILRD